jgi:hypothetical protein
VDRSATINAKDLSTALRQWIVSVLHVDLQEDDEFTVTLHRPVIRVPTAEQRQAAGDELMATLGQIHDHMRNVPEDEVDEAVDDALRAVRSGKH